MINLNYRTDHIFYEIFKISFEYIQKRYGEKTDNHPIRIYINRIENRITFKIKTGYYLKLLTPETMKLLGSTQSEMTKDENGENVPHL